MHATLPVCESDDDRANASGGSDWRNLRLQDGLAIFCGVAVICLCAYVSEFLPEPFLFGMGDADLEVDDIIVATFLVSIQVAVFSYRVHARTAPLEDDEE